MIVYVQDASDESDMDHTAKKDKKLYPHQKNTHKT